jgi:class 3 adenylate cyclase
MSQDQPHVLIVDDEPDIRATLQDYLAANGITASVAANGKACRQAMEENTFDLVLLDLKMPGEDGLSLCRHIRSSTNSAIIMITGVSEAMDRVVGLEVGADDYISKPFDLREVLARVRSVLRRANEQAASTEQRSGGNGLAEKLSGRGRVLLSVLFTDIVGSTTLAKTMGDRAWSDLLKQHDVQVRAALSDHDGLEVKAMGDGFVAAFDMPGSAVACAQSIRDRVSELGLSLRAGIHTGECELHGDDLAGIALHVAARIMDKAKGGDILVSRTVTDLMLGSTIEFVERGRFTLKGLGKEWRLFAVSDRRQQADNG